MLRPFCRSSVVLTTAQPSAPIVVSTPWIGLVRRSRCEAGTGSVSGATTIVMCSSLPRRIDRDDVGWPDPAQDRDLGLGEARRDSVAEEADLPAGIPRGEIVQVLERARLGHLDDRSADLEIAERLAWVVAEERDPRVAAHVPLLGEAAHRVDPHVLAVEVAPHDGG